jgi:ABC-type sulfate transport system substrate-binding protein
MVKSETRLSAPPQATETQRNATKCYRKRKIGTVLARYGNRADMVTECGERSYRVEILLPYETG